MDKHTRGLPPVLYFALDIQVGHSGGSTVTPTWIMMLWPQVAAAKNRAALHCCRAVYMHGPHEAA